MQDTIHKEVIIPSSIDAVWKAITDQEEITKWFLVADFKPEPGYNYTFKSPSDHCSPILGTVQSAIPYELIYTWQVEGTDVSTLVKWNLEVTPEGTKVSVNHSGIAKYAGTTAAEMFNSFNGGWDNCLNNLTSFTTAVTNEV